MNLMKITISLLIIIFLSSPILCYGATTTQQQQELKSTIENIQRSMSETHNTAQQLRNLDFEDHSEEILSLQSIWWILKDEESTLTKELQEIEEEIQKEKEQEIAASKGRYIGTFLATAYCRQCDGSGTTATGVRPVVGTTIAVDPRVIPYGTVLRLEDMNGNFIGQRIAQDTGGAIKGQRLDIFLSNCNECYNWGRRNVKVYIIN